MIRTRFAPSPTGFLHVGGLRTALYNFLFARQNNGRFVLRIEDTDQRRKVRGAVENLIDSMRWAGIEPDEGPQYGGAYGPYIQSRRLELYRAHAEILLRNGSAYRCFCSAERLNQLRREQAAVKGQLGYDRHCRNLPVAEAERRRAAGEAHVIRLRVPLGGEVVVEDLIRGRVNFPCQLLDDQVILKADGFPTYHLANVVDDHLMQISHVIRGEEWLPSTPKHQLLYQALGWMPPVFAHLPLLLNTDRSKLSKRQGDVSVEEYRRKGFLPEALVNFLSLLGWNPGTDQELFTLSQLIGAFSLERIGKSGSVFDIAKLRWMNEIYLRQLPVETLIERGQAFLPAPIASYDQQMAIFTLIRERLVTLADIPDQTRFLASIAPDWKREEFRELLQAPGAARFLRAMMALAGQEETWTGADFVEQVKQAGKTAGLKGKGLWLLIRIVLTGELHGPEIHTIAAILGRPECVRRMKEALPFVAD